MAAAALREMYERVLAAAGKEQVEALRIPAFDRHCSRGADTKAIEEEAEQEAVDEADAAEEDAEAAHEEEQKAPAEKGSLGPAMVDANKAFGDGEPPTTVRAVCILLVDLGGETSAKQRYVMAAQLAKLAREPSAVDSITLRVLPLSPNPAQVGFFFRGDGLWSEPGSVRVAVMDPAVSRRAVHEWLRTVVAPACSAAAGDSAGDGKRGPLLQRQLSGPARRLTAGVALLRGRSVGMPRRGPTSAPSRLASASSNATPNGAAAAFNTAPTTSSLPAAAATIQWMSTEWITQDVLATGRILWPPEAGNGEGVVSQHRLPFVLNTEACRLCKRTRASLTEHSQLDRDRPATEDHDHFAAATATGPVASAATAVAAGGGGHGLVRQAPFACLRTPAEGEVHENLNTHVTGVLTKLHEVYSITRARDPTNQHRLRFYKQAISAFSRLNFHVVDVSELQGIEGMPPLGRKMRDKIHEILTTGRLVELDALMENQREHPHIRAMLQFTNIHGIGPAWASKLVHQHRLLCIDDLRRWADTPTGREALHSSQLIGLKHYEDFNTKIPRAEVQQIESVVQAALRRLRNGSVFATTCGSYRRMKSHCGDVDILLTGTDPLQPYKEDRTVLRQLVDSLTKSGFITDELTSAYDHFERHHRSPRRVSTSGVSRTAQREADAQDEHRTSFMGVCKLPGPEKHLHRRLDIKYYARAYFPFATLYFTGSGHFNRSMRCLAHTKGLSLSDRGFCQRDPVSRQIVGRPFHAGCRTEEDIFRYLGMNYVPPNERECSVDAVRLSGNKAANHASDGERVLAPLRANSPGRTSFIEATATTRTAAGATAAATTAETAKQRQPQLLRKKTARTDSVQCAGSEPITVG